MLIMRFAAAAFASFMVVRLFSGIHINLNYLEETEYGRLDAKSVLPKFLEPKLIH